MAGETPLLTAVPGFGRAFLTKEMRLTAPMTLEKDELACRESGCCLCFTCYSHSPSLTAF